MARAYRINWREKIGGFQKFIANGSRGRVCVAGLETSACNTFLKVLHDLVEEADPHAIFEVVEPESGFAIEGSQIVERLENELGIKYERNHSQIHIHQNINAGEQVGAGPITAQISEEGSPAINLPDRFFRVKSELHQKNRRLIIFVINCHEVKKRTNYWLDYLCQDFPGQTAAMHTLIIRGCETKHRVCAHRHGLADPDHWISLPGRYQEHSLIDAIDDLADILKMRGFEEANAKIKAQSWLEAYEFFPKLLYENLMRLIYGKNSEQ